MSSSTYQLQVPDRIMSHFPGLQTFARDQEDKEINLHMHARVRSGDYFLTLATELDKIAQSLAGAKAPEAPELERIVAELISIGQDYTVTRK